MKFIVLMLAVFACSWGCGEIKRFKVGEHTPAELVYQKLFDSDEIYPLKDEWKELYAYLKKGHIQQAKKGNEFYYIYSHEFYKFLNRNLLKLYEVPFLQEYNQFISTFGVPRERQIVKGKIIIAYIPSVFGDPCQTCQHFGFTYTFDEKSKKLLKE